ncbi:MAG: hypothetical protein IJ666_06185 [Ruminococcus sp.]|nr:hypothetical protein [Ruminococcus sp.]
MKKYAVYKSDTGYYCREYVETMEQIAGTAFEHFVTEEKLPIIIDSGGGYSEFSEKDYRFVKIIETDKEPPLPVEKMYFKNKKDFKLGWMSPDGDTYSCDYTGHTKAAKYLAAKFFPGSKLPERALGKGGWLKIIDSWNGTEREHSQFVYSLSGKITKRQADRLFDLGLYNNTEVREMIKECENDW